MEQNIAIFRTNLEDIVQLVEDGTAEASVSQNPTFSWAKFILTDDMPNENKQRIPKEEFSNLIKTGILSPIKMEIGDPHGKHVGSTPLGVISNLKEVDNRIEGLAALWKEERTEDIEMLKKMYSENKLPQLSWEIMFSDLRTDENGVSDLLGTALRAVTIVGMPAYAGRTPIIALASTENTEELTVEEIDELKTKVSELEGTLATKDEELLSMKEKMAELQSYKDTIEKEKADAEKLASIKKKFGDAGIKKDEEYFAEKKDTFLKMDDESIDFFIQELVAFSKTSTSERLPNVIDTTPIGELSIKELAEKLRQSKIKQQ